MNYWVGAVDARNREYAQLMRKFQVEANLHDATKRSLSEQLHDKQALQVRLPSVIAALTMRAYHIAALCTTWVSAS